MEMEWKWNGNGTEMERKWNGNGILIAVVASVFRFSGGHFLLAVSKFSGGDFLSGGFRIFWSSLSGDGFRIFWRFRIFWIFFLDFFSGGHLFLVVFRISWRSQNFLAVTFPNFLAVPESAQMRLCSNHSPPLVQG